VTGKTQIVVVIGFYKLVPAWPTMGVMAVKAGNLSLEVFTLLEVDPLLMMLPGMGLAISPNTWFELVVIRQGFTKFVGLVVFVIPGKFKCAIGNAHAP
jgi:hypothetical protein